MGKSSPNRIKMVLALVLGVICLAPSMQQMAHGSSHIIVPVGQEIHVPQGLSLAKTASSSNKFVAECTTPTASRDVSVFANHIGETEVTTKLFGVVPWRDVRVDVVPTTEVLVGGQSVGIRLKSKGAMVVGFQKVGTENSPSQEADVHIGDVIEEINHQAVTDVSDIRKWVERSPQNHVELSIKRGTIRKIIRVSLVSDPSGRHLGLYVRDKTAGVGTLTFYDPKHQRFGALGHVITDVDTGRAIHGSGSLYEAEITGIVKGVAGRPGEKRGRFENVSHALGDIDDNSAYGVFGAMQLPPPHSCVPAKLPIALPTQVHEGMAKMYTVVHGENVESFDVRIENLVRQHNPDTKSMIVRVTDERLLKETGGIVQGMSGSPLVQDGRLVGAVTHVFVSDPTRGYGIYADWMLRKSGPPKLEEDTISQMDAQIV